MACLSRKIIFTTFGGGTQHFLDQAAKLGREAERTGWFADVRVWTDQSLYGSIFEEAAPASLQSLDMAHILDFQFAQKNQGASDTGYGNRESLLAC